MLKQWYILIVKSRNEIKIAKQLAELNIDVYCPTVKEVRIWSDRKKTVVVPLFKSYLFVHLTEKERCSAFAVPGVVRYLFWLGKPAIVRDDEMETLKTWLSNEHVEDVSVSKIVPGDQLTIQQGLLKNKNAIVQEVGKKRVKLLIPGLGMVVNVKLKELA